MKLKINVKAKNIILLFLLSISFIVCDETKMNNKNDGKSIFHYWVQRYDYSSKEFKNISFEQAIKAFHDYDWQKELSCFKEGSGDKDCPPGIGIHNGFNGLEKKGLLLHICPYDKTTVDFHFHYFRSEKFLIFFKSKKANIHYVTDYPKEKVSNLIKLFFDRKINKILEIESNLKIEI